MKTSIYISNASITAVTGEDKGRKLSVKAFAREQMPSGIVYNGSVTDKQQLATQLGTFFNVHGIKRTDVSLVVDSDHIAAKMLDVPVVKRKQLAQIVQNEFAGQNSGDVERVYDYTVVRGKLKAGGARIYAVQVEKPLLQAYIDVFEEVGIKLKGIDVTQTCAMRFFGRVPGYQKRAFIFSRLDGPDMLSMLFADNEYVFSNRSQLLEPRGTPAAAVEISRALSAMVQYNYARSSTGELKNTYLCGITGQEAQFYSDIGNALSMMVGPPAPVKLLSLPSKGKERFEYGEYVFCLGDLMEE